ncbi:hypothetical protein PFISCL1PPCAC_28814, partial [Pristionchus fissidentatus]
LVAARSLKKDRSYHLRINNLCMHLAPDLHKCHEQGMESRVNYDELSLARRAFLDWCYDYYEEYYRKPLRPEYSIEERHKVRYQLVLSRFTV